MKRFILISALLLAGCVSANAATKQLTTTQAASNPLAMLQTFTLTDLQAALADAQAQTPPDTLAATCYTALISLVQNVALPASQKVTGAFLVFQKARDIKSLVANLQASNGPLSSLNVACAPLVLDTQNTLVGLGIMGGAIIGKTLVLP